LRRLLLHAIATADEARVDVRRGLRGQPLRVVRCAELSAFASLLDEPAQPFGRADLLEHHAIVSQLAAQLDAVLPARFPTWFADDRALQAQLELRHGDLGEALLRVRDRCELALTAVWTSPPDEAAPRPPTTPGRTYLLGRQQALTAGDTRRARAQALADQSLRLVGSDLVDVRQQICPSTTVALSAAFLVRREIGEKIKARLLRDAQDVRILVNGPWPAYTFATVV